ncbi:MAG: FG-GAP-like repeat-containing protein [Casimicrobiaceae bacterium]
MSRTDVIAMYRMLFQPQERVSSSWTGAIDVSATPDVCNPGTTSTQYQQAAINTVNFYRALAGLPGNVTLLSGSPAVDTQHAAMMMTAERNLSHTPDPSWKCYTASGANGAGKSNLALGRAGVFAIDAYMDDFGAGNEFVGHRRWILYPPQLRMASGSIPGGVNDASNSLWVFDNVFSNPRPPTPHGVAWPPRGYVPWDVLPEDSNRWSFSFPAADFSSATVTVSRNGTILPPVAYEPLGTSYGDNTLVFRPQGVDYGKPLFDVTYNVSVNNVSVSGVTRNFSYQVTVIDPDDAVLEPSLSLADFDANGRKDLMWRDPATGIHQMWLMNGKSVAQAATVLGPSTWSLALVDELNGDGKTDLVWRDNATGATQLWLMNGTGVAQAVPLTGPTTWRPMFAGQFSGGRGLLWRDSATGTTQLWQLNAFGTTISAANLTGPTSWVPVAASDFNGDGITDFAWRDSMTGAAQVWLMKANGSGAASATALIGATSWQLVLTGRFAGDGRMGLIWRDPVSGASQIWLMRADGTGISVASELSGAGSWAPIHAGDLNGDGKTDLIWRDLLSGATQVWLMNGTTTAGAVNLLGPTTWAVHLAADFNGDGTADLLWRDQITGASQVWITNPTTIMAADSGALLGPTVWALANP